MRAAWLTTLLLISANQAPASDFPVRDPETAIRIAKEVCRGKADANLQWRADLDRAGKTWSVNTIPSIHKSGDPLWVVEIPVNGPRPTECNQSLYLLMGPPQPH